MVFASPIFLFLFLPLTLAAYFALPLRFGNSVLLAASVVFYAWGEGVHIIIVLGSIAFNWLLAMRIGTLVERSAKRRALALAVAGNLILLGIFKYANFTVANLDAAAGALGLGVLTLASVPLPLGISFFTFHSISYLVDIYRGNAAAQRQPGRFALYILLFPQLIAGPIIRYKDIARQIDARPRRLDDFAEGARRFSIGLGKKVLVANTLGRVADQVFAIPSSALNTPMAWLGVVCYTLQIYFDFSGYSDMAIGLMRMFGFRVLENFNYPYISQSIREFWRRWHISLSTFFRDYLYVPLGGKRCGTARAYANLAIVFVLCGLWHGASWTFVLWGLWHGAFLVLERAGLEAALARTWRPVRHAYALSAITGGWVLFRSTTLAQAAAFYAALAGFGAPTELAYPPGMLLDGLTALTLAVAVIGAMPLARLLSSIAASSEAVTRWPGRLAATSELAWLGAMFIGAGAYLAAGTYNPFIYFRF